MPTTQPVLIAGGWRDADTTGTFQAANPDATVRFNFALFLFFLDFAIGVFFTSPVITDRAD